MATSRVADWAMIALVALSLLIVPVLIRLGVPILPYRLSLVVLPLVPAFTLALAGVWFALRRRGDGDGPPPA